MAKKIGVCLGAGGSRGVAHLGAIKALEENNIKIDYITGCSMGSVVGGCYTAGYSIEEMSKLALEFKKNDLIDVHINPIRNLGLLRSQKFHAVINDLLKEVTFDQLRIPFECVSVDLLSGQEYVFNQGKVADAVISSASIPFIFKPYEYNGMMLIDGGVFNRVPIKQLRDMGADSIIAFDVLGPIRPMKRINHIIDLAFRYTDLVDWQFTNKEYSVDSGNILIMPDLGDMSQYKFEKIDFAIEKGYEACMEKMDEIKELIK